MKRIKTYLLFLALLFSFSLANPASAQAAAKLSQDSLVLLTGQSAPLKATGTKAKITWKSSRESVATVDTKGTVTAKKKGTAVITASFSKKKLACRVSVQSPALSRKSLSLAKGKSATLSLNGTNQKITWASSDRSIAAVSSSGKITAKKTGTATISATVLKRKFTCRVTVKASSSGNSSSRKSSGRSKSSSGSIVWIPRTGSKYHSTSTCSNMKNPSKVTLAKAVAAGYEPCKRCH